MRMASLRPADRVEAELLIGKAGVIDADPEAVVIDTVMLNRLQVGKAVTVTVTVAGALTFAILIEPFVLIDSFPKYGTLDVGAGIGI